MKKKLLSVFAALLLGFTVQAQATDYTRLGWSCGFELGGGFFATAGYCFNPHVGVTLDLGVSGAMIDESTLGWRFSGLAEGHFYLLDRKTTPMASLRLGTFGFSEFVFDAMVGAALKNWELLVGYRYYSGINPSGLAFSVGYNWRF